MKRSTVLGLMAVLILMIPTISTAESWDLSLSAGNDSVIAGIHKKSYLDTGYMRIGGNGIFLDDDETEANLGKFDFTVGTDTLMPGMNVDIGLFTALGSVSEDNDEGDVGTVGFTLSASYFFSADTTGIPIEIGAAYAWGPESLAFADSENYCEFSVSLGVRVMSNASILLSYVNYDMDMETDDRDWNVGYDTYQLGLVMRF